MRQLSFDSLQVAALYELYMATVLDGMSHVPADDLATRIGHGCTKGYLLVALSELDRQGALNYNSTSGNRNSAILPEGIRLVEKGLRDPKSNFSKIRDEREQYAEDGTVTVISAPASDRVVRLDHNSAPLQEIVRETSDLKQKIRLGNDLGDLTEDEAEAASSEIAQIEQAMQSEAVRPNQIYSFARKTLKWIAEKAAGAAVGKAAIALLALIAAYFGFSV